MESTVLYPSRERANAVAGLDYKYNVLEGHNGFKLHLVNTPICILNIREQDAVNSCGNNLAQLCKIHTDGTNVCKCSSERVTPGVGILHTG